MGEKEGVIERIGSSSVSSGVDSERFDEILLCDGSASVWVIVRILSARFKESTCQLKVLTW